MHAHGFRPRAPYEHWHFQPLAKVSRRRLLAPCDLTCILLGHILQAILNPGKTENAPRVFLDFISYSAGPLPEEQLEILSSSEYLTSEGTPKIPVSILWGDKDPWEPVAEGRCYEKFGCVDEFKVLNGAGHCPQDEAPQLVNPLVVDFVQRYAGVGAMSKKN
jgi:pimeloyl-ACP methyl ester carboxylesterase